MNHKKTFSQIGLTLFLGTLIIFGVQLLAMAIAVNIPAIYSNGDLYFLTSMLPMYIIAFPLIFLMFKKIPVQLTGEKKKMRIRHLLAASLICYAIAFVFNIIGSMITGIIGLLRQDTVEHVMSNITSSISPVTNFLIIVICAPIMEELLFRKAIISRTSQYGEGIAVVFSAFIFGLFHGNLVQFGYAFLIGIFFGFVFIKTRKIIYSILMHMFVNFVGSFLGSFLLEQTNIMEYLNKVNELTLSGASEAELTALVMDNMSGLLIMFLFGLCLIVFVITGIILFFVNLKKFIFAPGEITIEKGKRFSTLFINIGMILYSIFWIIQIILQLFQ